MSLKARCRLSICNHLLLYRQTTWRRHYCQVSMETQDEKVYLYDSPRMDEQISNGNVPASNPLPKNNPIITFSHFTALFRVLRGRLRCPTYSEDDGRYGVRTDAKRIPANRQMWLLKL